MLKYPTKVQTNMRRRGPVESHKMNRSNSELLADVTRLFQAFNDTSESLEEMKYLLREGNDDIEGVEKVSRDLLVLERRIRKFQGGLTRV